MPQWYVAVSIRTHEPMTDSVLDRFDGFRPEDDEQCIWVNEDEDTLLSVTTELRLADSEAALDAGRGMAQEAIAALASAACVEEVVVQDVDDETGTYFRWTPDREVAPQPSAGRAEQSP